MAIVARFSRSFIDFQALTIVGELLDLATKSDNTVSWWSVMPHAHKVRKPSLRESIFHPRGFRLGLLASYD